MRFDTVELREVDKDHVLLYPDNIYMQDRVALIKHPSHDIIEIEVRGVVISVGKDGAEAMIHVLNNFIAGEPLAADI